MSNEGPNTSGESNSVHAFKNEIPTEELLLIVNRAFSAWASMRLYCNTSIWQDGECRPEKCAETIRDFAATLSLAPWRDRINSMDHANDNADAVGILRVAMSASKEDIAQAIVIVGAEKWPAACEWFAQELPELLEFPKVKPEPYSELFVIEIAILENYRNEAKAFREMMDRRSNRWPVLRDLARSKFGHLTFTWETMECLNDWLLARCEGDEDQRGWLTLTDVANLLSEGDKKKRAGANASEGADDAKGKRKKKKPGPTKARYNCATDKKVFDQWEYGCDRGSFSSYEDCDKMHKHPLGTTKSAVARHRGRERNAK
jgi:hypothetical protein